MLKEEDCGKCNGTGKNPNPDIRDHWGNPKVCYYCCNGKVLTEESEEQLEIIRYWLRRGYGGFDDVYEFKHEN